MFRLTFSLSTAVLWMFFEGYIQAFEYIQDRKKTTPIYISHLVAFDTLRSCGSQHPPKSVDSRLSYCCRFSPTRDALYFQGRTFDGHMLDMIELGLVGYRGLGELAGLSKRVGSKPAFVFAGEKWGREEAYRKLQNLLLGELRGGAVVDIGQAERWDEEDERGGERGGGGPAEILRA